MERVAGLPASRMRPITLNRPAQKASPRLRAVRACRAAFSTMAHAARCCWARALAKENFRQRGKSQPCRSMTRNCRCASRIIATRSQLPSPRMRSFLKPHPSVLDLGRVIRGAARTEAGNTLTSQKCHSHLIIKDIIIYREGREQPRFRPRDTPPPACVPPHQRAAPFALSCLLEISAVARSGTAFRRRDAG